MPRIATIKLPTIIFLDLDKTVIGRADAAVERFFLRKVIDEVFDAGELAERPRPLSPKDEMGPLIRPGFGEAMQRIKKALPIFACTMGVAATVIEMKVPGIEQATGIRFNRPIFHKGICQSAADPGKKLVRQCFDLAIDHLAKRSKYGDCLRRRRNKVFEERFFMVDDTADVAFDDASNAKMVLCPPYVYAPRVRSYVDPFVGIDSKVLESPKVALYIASMKVNAEEKEKTQTALDTFWPDLAHAIEQNPHRHKLKTT